MKIQEKWKAYCDHETRYATHDDWLQFVNEIYTGWLAEKLKADPNYDPLKFVDGHNYIEREYSFDVFIDTSAEFAEIRKLEPVKFEI